MRSIPPRVCAIVLFGVKYSADQRQSLDSTAFERLDERQTRVGEGRGGLLIQLRSNVRVGLIGRFVLRLLEGLREVLVVDRVLKF